MAVAYRPDVNRRNLISPSIGENPMFSSFKEKFIGFLSFKESFDMIIEIGLWKDIKWEKRAAERIYYYCGGHPMISRIFAGLACEHGSLQYVDYAKVEETAEYVCKTFRKNEIGDYYKNGVWNLMTDKEQQVLILICKAVCRDDVFSENSNSKLHDSKKSDSLSAFLISESQIPADLEDALTNLEHFGLVINDDGWLYFSSALFIAWLKRRIG